MGHIFTTPVDVIMKRIADRRGITVEQLTAELRDRINSDDIVESLDLSLPKTETNIKQPTLFERACRFLDDLDVWLFGGFRRDKVTFK